VVADGDGRAAALLMFALPGGAYIYQGEELGFYEVEDIPEELLQDPTWEPGRGGQVSAAESDGVGDRMTDTFW
jgi:glycosidase